MPWASGCACRNRCLVAGDSPFSQFLVPGLPPLPLSPDYGAEPSSYPRFKILENYRGLTEAEVATPAGEILRKIIHRLLYAPASSREFPNSRLEALERYRSYPPLEFLAPRKTEAQELALLRLSYRALFLVDLELEFTRCPARSVLT
jgi:hypothetical protein